MMTSSERVAIIYNRLQQALTPTKLEVFDESHHHIGHAGAQKGGSHIKLVIASPLFQGKTLVACHRLVYAALGDLMREEIHALQIDIPDVTVEK